MKKYGHGWFNESNRHRLARLGIKTGRKTNYSLGINYASYTNISIGHAFFDGKTRGKSLHMEIVDKGDKTLLVGYGWAVYGSRDKKTGKVTFYKGWDGYSKTTSKHLSQTHLRGARKVSDKKPQLSDFAKQEKKGTKFGILTKEGVKKQMTIDISKVKSPDPLAYSYGYFQAKSGQPMSKDKDLAPEYIRGYKDAKAGKKIGYAKKVPVKIDKLTKGGALLEALKGMKYGERKEIIWNNRVYGVYHTPAEDFMIPKSSKMR